jgi:hypothetical protein
MPKSTLNYNLEKYVIYRDLVGFLDIMRQFGSDPMLAKRYDSYSAAAIDKAKLDLGVAMDCHILKADIGITFVEAKQ